MNGLDLEHAVWSMAENYSVSDIQEYLHFIEYVTHPLQAMQYALDAAASGIPDIHIVMQQYCRNQYEHANH